jgi:hypothetical protein
MARQGNFVTLPGGGVNFTQGLSDALGGLAESYNKKAAIEQDRKLQEKTLAESARRYEEDTRRWNIDSAGRQKDRANLLTQQGIENDRFAKAAALKEEERLLTKRLTGEFSETALRQQKLKNSPHLLDKANAVRQQNRWNIDRNTLAQVMLLGETEEAKAARELEHGTSLLESQVPKQQAATDALAAYKDSDNPLIQKLMAQRQTETEALKKASDNYVDNELPLYQGEMMAQLGQYYISQGMSTVGANALVDLMTRGKPKKEDLSARALKQQQFTSARNKQIAELAYKVKALDKNSLDTLDQKAGYDTYAEKEIAKLDAGWIDSATLMGYYKRSVAKGTDARVALKAAQKFVEVNLVSNDLRGGEAAFGVLADAITVKHSGDGGSTSRSILDAITPREAEYIDPMFTNLKAYYGGLTNLGPDANKHALTGHPLKPKAPVVDTVGGETKASLSREETLATFPAKDRNRMSAFYEEVDVMNALKKSHGEDVLGKDSKTLLVHPHDENDKPVSWAEQVVEINNSVGIALEDQISVGEEKAAANNPEKQAEIRAYSNELIKAAANFESKSATLLGGAANTTKEYGIAAKDLVTGIFGDNDSLKRREGRKAEQAIFELKQKNLDRLQMFLADKSGNSGNRSMQQSAIDFVSNSPSAQVATGVVTAGAAATVLPGIAIAALEAPATFAATRTVLGSPIATTMARFASRGIRKELVAATTRAARHVKEAAEAVAKFNKAKPGSKSWDRLQKGVRESQKRVKEAENLVKELSKKAEQAKFKPTPKGNPKPVTPPKKASEVLDALSRQGKSQKEIQELMRRSDSKSLEELLRQLG